VLANSMVITERGTVLSVFQKKEVHLYEICGSRSGGGACM